MRTAWISRQINKLLEEDNHLLFFQRKEEKKLNFKKENISKILVVILGLALLGGTVGANALNNRKEETDSQIYDVKEALEEYSYSDKDETDYNTKNIQSLIDELPKNKQEKFSKELETIDKAKSFTKKMNYFKYDEEENTDYLMLKYPEIESKYQSLKKSYSKLNKEVKKEVDYEYKDLVKAHDYAFSKDSKISPTYYPFYSYKKSDIENMYNELEKLNFSYSNYFGVNKFQEMVKDRLDYLNMATYSEIPEKTQQAVNRFYESMKKTNSSVLREEPQLQETNQQAFDKELQNDAYIIKCDDISLIVNSEGDLRGLIESKNTRQFTTSGYMTVLKNEDVFNNYDESARDYWGYKYHLELKNPDQNLSNDIEIIE